MTARSKAPEEWPFSCEVCGGWCHPAAELLATTDPLERGGLVAESILHSLGRRAADLPETGTK